MRKLRSRLHRAERIALCRAMPMAALACFLGGCGATLNESTQISAADGGSRPAMALSAEPVRQGPSETGSLSLPAPEAHQAAKLTAVSDPSSSAYKIGPLDVIEVSVFNVPELSRTVQVANSGTINLPLVGEVPAAGRTAQDVERDLTKRLGAKYLQSPQVNLYIKEYNSQRVTIDGSVKKPGVYPVRGGATLLQLIATAEGLTDTAQSEVAVFRNVNGKRQAAKFDLNAIREGTAKDPQIVEGDLIVVSDSTFKSTYQGLLKALPITSIFVTLL